LWSEDKDLSLEDKDEDKDLWSDDKDKDFSLEDKDTVKDLWSEDIRKRT